VVNASLKADSVTQLCNSSTRANQKSQRSDSALPGPLCGFRDEFKVPKWAHYSPRARARENARIRLRGLSPAFLRDTPQTINSND